MPVRLEVHREEGDVAQHVAVPQPVVEGQAVEHPRAVGQAEDVVGEEVAVAVAHPALGDAPLQQGAPAPQVRPGQGARALDALAGHDLGRDARELVEALLPQPEHRGDATRLGDPRRGRRLAVKPGDHARDGAHEVGRLGALQQRRQAPGVRHAAHLDQVVARVPVIVDHVEHAQVHVGREAPVHLGLAPAGVQAVLAAAVVEEGHLDRLQQLVRAVADHRDHRDVCLDELGRGWHRSPPSYTGPAPSSRVARARTAAFPPQDPCTCRFADGRPRRPCVRPLATGREA